MSQHRYFVLEMVVELHFHVVYVILKLRYWGPSLLIKLFKNFFTNFDYILIVIRILQHLEGNIIICSCFSIC